MEPDVLKKKNVLWKHFKIPIAIPAIESYYTKVMPQSLLHCFLENFPKCFDLTRDIEEDLREVKKSFW